MNKVSRDNNKLPQMPRSAVVVNRIQRATIAGLVHFSQWERTVAAGRFQVVLPMRGDEEFRKAGILVGQIVLLLQIDAVHLIPYFLEVLCRWTKPDEMHSRMGGYTHRPL